jgi:hypothetical protein
MKSVEQAVIHIIVEIPYQFGIVNKLDSASASNYWLSMADVLRLGFLENF